MLNWLRSVFAHKHHWEHVNHVTHQSKVIPGSAFPVTANIYRCRCGAEKRDLTDAGRQQVEAGDNVQEVLGYVVYE